MCGIAGFVNRAGQPADRAIVERMTATLAHRGPDGEGFYCEGPAALGHRRLSIIDVGRRRPADVERGRLDLDHLQRRALQRARAEERARAKGHRYRTVCDTESLVHLYEEEGLDFARRLNGMFARRSGTPNRSRLVLVRDRMGQKPLFYGELPGGGLAFGSEPKAVLAHPEIRRELDHASLARYLFYEYVPAPYSIWRSLHKLPRGHALCWEDGSIRVWRYWDPPGSRRAGDSTSKPAAERFWTELRDSVARHRRSDVPIGVFLSGGIDSSSVAAALCEVEPPRERPHVLDRL